MFENKPIQKEKPDLEKIREECAKKIQTKMDSLGYDSEGINFILENLNRVISLYKDQGAVWQNLTQQITASRLRRPFGEKEFKLFLKDIDPTNISEAELERELGITEDELEYMPEERESYYKEREKFIKKKIEKNSMKTDFFKNEALYEILTKAGYQKLTAAEGGDDKTPKIRFIYTPVGGQPGYRKQFKRRS